MTPKIDSQRQLLQGLLTLADLEGGRRDLSGLLTRAATLVRDVLGVERVYVAVSHEKSNLVAATEAGRGLVHTDPWEGPGPLGRLVIGQQDAVLWKLESDQNGPSPADRVGARNITEWAGLPIPLALPSGGLVVAMSDGERPLRESDVDVMETIATHLSVSIDNLLTYQKTEALALTDELTRLYNFRFLKTALKREMERAARYGQVFSIIMVDVDHLKRYNDLHGHLAGSELLRQLAGILSRSSRAIDLVAKYGGDEFLVILPQTRLDGALSMANRLRSAVEEMAFDRCQPGDMTISVGVASYPQHGDTVKALVGAADRALFQAKRTMRNCVVSADGSIQSDSDCPETLTFDLSEPVDGENDVLGTGPPRDRDTETDAA